MMWLQVSVPNWQIIGYILGSLSIFGFHYTRCLRSKCFGVVNMFYFLTSTLHCTPTSFKEILPRIFKRLGWNLVDFCPSSLKVGMSEKIKISRRCEEKVQRIELNASQSMGQRIGPCCVSAYAIIKRQTVFSYLAN